MKKNTLTVIFIFLILFPIQAQTLYGLTPRGGNDGVGSLIKFIPATNNLAIVKSFENYAKYPYHTNLIQASNGKLYGMTLYGGDDRIGGPGYGGGVLFSFDPSTSIYTKLKNFNAADGPHPVGSLIQAGDGKLYGMTGTTIFSFDPSSLIYTKLKVFGGADGAFPSGSLLQASDGKLYGMTSGGGSLGKGVIFSFDLSTSAYTKLKDFDIINGASPLGSLLQASDGKLYGMTSDGGSGMNPNSFRRGGVIFSFDPSTSIYTKLKDFDSPGGPNGSNPMGSLMQANDGKLYGMTTSGGSNLVGVIFSFDPLSSAYTKLKDLDYGGGAAPFGSLMQASDGKLYGMTSDGGNGGANNSYGVIFFFDPSSSIYTKLYDFDGVNGQYPTGNLIQVSNGKIYGMTTWGGTGGGNSSNGVIFSFDPLSATYTKLKDFEAQDGRNPSGSLAQASNGKLYGMTFNGGRNGVGVIFSLNPSDGAFTKLKDFNHTDGAYPNGGLIQASDGKLYGMTSHGAAGINYEGVIFSFDPSTSIYTKLKDFDGPNGSHPEGSLIQASDGKLYGMASVIFSFDPLTSTYTKLKDIDCDNGCAVFKGNLVQAGNGKLYGMTKNGGSNFAGILFSFDPVTSTYIKLKDLEGTPNYGPNGSLMKASDGKLYGMTYSGGNFSSGTIFSFDPFTLIYTKLKDFDGTNGYHPVGNLMQASDGKLYGMAGAGGAAGVIFSFDPLTSIYTKLADFDGYNDLHPWINSALTEVTGVVTGLNDITNSLREVKVFPNPASGSTTISFFLRKSEKVSVKIFDITGRKVRALIEKTLHQGENSFQWNTSGIRAGMYFFKIDAGTYSVTKIFSVIK